MLVLDWPWWVGLFLLLGLVGMWHCGLSSSGRSCIKKKEQQFVSQIIEQDEALYKIPQGGRDRSQVTELQDRFKEAVDALEGLPSEEAGQPALCAAVVHGHRRERLGQDHRHQERQARQPLCRDDPDLGAFRHKELRLVVLRAGRHHRHGRPVCHSRGRGPGQG
ncbi:MAG: hypothetical protein MZV70_53410 [Desulfobacterales bacterium]|nr:hypothetical protein [Desulfobacterales bacterium]